MTAMPDVPEQNHEDPVMKVFVAYRNLFDRFGARGDVRLHAQEIGREAASDLAVVVEQWLGDIRGKRVHVTVRAAERNMLAEGFLAELAVLVGPTALTCAAYGPHGVELPGADGASAFPDRADVVLHLSLTFEHGREILLHKERVDRRRFRAREIFVALQDIGLAEFETLYGTCGYGNPLTARALRSFPDDRDVRGDPIF